MCIRDYELKTHVQEERCIKLRQTDKLRQISHQSDTNRQTFPYTWHRNKRERAIQSQWMPIENPQRTTTRNSLAESPILLRREIGMAWGTTTDNLNPEINISQYEIEIKCLTLKDQTSYLIPDGWSRSPLSFPISAWIDESLPQQQVKKTSILSIGVRSTLSYIINNI